MSSNQQIEFLRRILVCVLIAALAAAVGSSPAHAQDPAREQAFVYGISNFNGAKYESALVPPSQDTIYLLSGRENIIAPRETMIYFWPVTNQYLADWEKLNQLVEGTLEVYQNGRLVTTVPLSSYVIQYDVNDPEGTLALYTGAEADARYAAWQQALEDYQDALVAYYQALGEWDKEIIRLRDESPNGVIPPEKVPTKPEQPQRPRVLSTNPAKGFVLDLPDGTYNILVKRADGTVQPDSQKRLVMFNKERDGIAYSVVPSTRWNLPEQSDEPESVIYSMPGITLYLQAFKAGRFNDYAYAHMLNPQDDASQPDRGRWVSFDPTTAPQMQLARGGQVVDTISSQPYLVRQVSGSGLGYEVVPFDPNTMERFTFEGYTIPLTAPGEEYTVELVNPDGTPIPGSRRRIIALDQERALLPYTLSALPLVVGAGVLVWRRRQARRIRVDA